ncbi:hybrid sensor histidine kinase/response regulator transcription factor [Saccharicrinis fermentans]|uniref:histidine kinase n=2 Tax=Saccharicrinis fermentans TaxID=982 RepID=W7Y172_9BACT|nr:two-component regulator propeller domain-containing protein [Saccharicrinis fermentans]GAF04660.1 sensor protein EvgS precursor [Saccharicrinis fermentans DSM 9555 = JCM 21142]
MSFCEDKSGNIWIGTFDSGINIFKKNDNLFVHIKDNYLPSGMQNNRVRSIYQDSEQDIWIGTKVGGALSKFNRQTLSFTHYRHDPSDPFSISSDFIFCITEDRPGYLWVGTSHGLNLFEKKTGKSKSFFPVPDNPKSINSGEIYALLKVEDDLFIGTAAGGLNVLDTKKNVVTHYMNTPDSNSISSNNIWVIKKDNKNNIWIGSENGLNLFHRETGVFTRFQNNPEDSKSISDNDIKCIYEDNERNLWIGTIYGLNLMDSVNNTFTVYTTDDGLPGNYISSVLGDSLGYLWISTKKGLSRFNPETGTFRNFTVLDGLQDNEFSPNVQCKTKNGEMLFGGNNGFNIFHPDSISFDQKAPEIKLTDFRLFNKHVGIDTPGSPLKKHISRCNEITLSHEQTVLTIDYVAFNYYSPEKTQYAYIMDGFEKQWNYVGNKREATYTNLDPGTYVFRVKASNTDGLWNEEGVSLIINILPPLWKTWWAYSLYALSFILILLLIRHYSLKRIHEEKKREQDQQNLKFFINVSHEFRTPLTLIFTPIKKILSSNNIRECKEAAQDINLSANKLIYLINQLLDLRKTDLGQLPLIAVKTDIVRYSHEIFNLFKGIGESKNISFIFQSSNSTIQAWFDPDKYEKILNNLLSNAIKYTGNGGELILSISRTDISDKKTLINYQKKKEKRKYVEIKVQDTGIGLSKEQIKHIFERFYSRDASNTGTGIGLNYSKSLVELHSGHILVESELGKGSTFIVLLPLGNKHLKANQISKTNFNLNNYKFKLNQLESLEFDIAATDDFSEHKNTVEEDIKLNPDNKLPLILIVEDNRKLRKQLKDELKNNYNIKEAINGKDGLEKVEKYYPDLIISDIMMPIMDGINLCHQIKTNIDTCHIPMVLLTAKNLAENKVEGFKTGADEYISKPFILSILKARIENLLESRKRLKKKYKSTSVLIPAKEVTSNNLDEQFLEKLTQIVLENIPDCNFSPTDLEKIMGVSRTKLYLKINSLTGNGTGNFIRDIRLKYAAELILQKKYRISEISFMAGFRSHAYFTKIFHDKFGITPLQYQKKNSSI